MQRPDAAAIRAVIFDLGGVILGSPLHAIRDYERAEGLPPNCINRVVVATGPAGAWSRLERGEVPLAEFHALFEAECARAGARIDARALMQRMAEAAQPRPAMLEAVARIRASGRRAAALTNNWASESDASRRDSLQNHFDLFVESSVVGLRKPDPAIYRYTCERLGAEPAACAFLDDIGSNLKSARALGMATIKVDEAAAALRELSALLDLPLGV